MIKIIKKIMHLITSFLARLTRYAENEHSNAQWRRRDNTKAWKPTIKTARQTF